MEKINKIQENLKKIQEYETLIAKLKKENDDIYYSITQQYDKTPIEQLNLSKRTFKMVRDHARHSSYRTVADIITNMMTDIASISNTSVKTRRYLRGYGLNCWIELCEKLEEMGYSDDNTKTILKEHEVYHLDLPGKLVTMLINNKIYSKEQLKRAYKSGDLMKINYMCMFKEQIEEVIF